MEIRWQIEIDPFCNKVLAKHWPEVTRYGDIKKIKKGQLESVDVVCGGFPCQPFSSAGKQRGKNDDRYLWPYMLRIIRDIKPRWIIAENVAGIIHMVLDEVLFDLENEDYECGTFIIPACGINAPHRRDRVWIIAYSNQCRWKSIKSNISQKRRNLGKRFLSNIIDNRESFWSDWSSEKANWILPLKSNACRRNDGVSSIVDRLKSLGNAVVPQVVEIIGKAIMEVERLSMMK